MKVLVTGSAGQVGRAILRTAPGAHVAIGMSHRELDITDPDSVRCAMTDIRPDVVINAAAYTSVDEAERTPSIAHAVNARGPLTVALEARRRGVRLLQLSTDYVFDGTSSSAYATDAAPSPLSEYGKSKWKGEQAVREVFGDSATILRTSWVYDREGRNFLCTMLRHMRDHHAVRVVMDQIGAPTAAIAVADALWRLVERKHLAGTFHWTDSGIASWYDFAVAIAEEGEALGLLSGRISITPISSDDFPSLAKRPRFSVLDTRSTAVALDLAICHWRTRLRQILGDKGLG